MTFPDLLAALDQLEITLMLDGEQLRISAPQGHLTPGLHEAVRAQKAELLRMLKAPLADLEGEPCPVCGSTGKWRWLDGRLICRLGLIRGDHR